MAAPDWEALRELWATEGCFRDIQVAGVTADEWQAVLEAVTGRWPFTYEVDGDPAPLPDARSFFRDGRHLEATHLLRVAVSPSISVNAHFHDDEEIEFDVDPRELHGESDLAAVLEFMRVVGRALRKPVLLSAEVVPRVPPELRYDPVTDAVVAEHHSGGSSHAA